ncbi:MAG: DUF4434 domain-containing protein [Victivallaceae bacterium]|nr:DUF4434 domain-containing protein [Victivallaceae bacterium]
MTDSFHPENTRLITGTFLQLDHWDDREGARFQQELRSLNPDHWRQMLHDMAAIGIDTLVFQQSADARNGLNDVRFYHPGGSRPVPDWMKDKENLYSEVIDEADRLGMKVFHALYGMYLPSPAEQTDTAIRWGRQIMTELLERYGDRPSFAGWYWTYEYPPSTPAGRDSLKRIVPALREISDAPLLIAPNADRGMSATLLQDIDVDVIAYQDCVGVGVEPDIFGRYARANRFRSLARLPFVYEELKFAHDAWNSGDLWNQYSRARGKTKLWNDVEIWEFDNQRTLLPTELSRITAQLDMTAPFVEKQIIYQYPGLMHHPNHPVHVGGERAATLYENYAIYRQALLEGRK